MDAMHICTLKLPLQCAQLGPSSISRYVQFLLEGVTEFRIIQNILAPPALFCRATGALAAAAGSVYPQNNTFHFVALP